MLEACVFVLGEWVGDRVRYEWAWWAMGRVTGWGKEEAVAMVHCLAEVAVES